MTTSLWTVTAVDAPGGASPAVIPGANVERVTYALNEPATADLVVRRSDPQLAEFLDPTREIQIHRDGTLLLWGPAVRPEIDQDFARIQVADPAWYLTRRFFGRAGRMNFLTNGDFEDGTTGWTAEGLTPVIDPFRAVNGTKSVRLTGTAEGHDTYLHQTYTHTQVHPDGDLLTIAAWVWVPSADYQGDATRSLGLFVERRNSGGDLIDIAGDADDDNPTLINDRLPKNQWWRLETTLPNVKDGDTIEVRLYPPWGTAWWDLATLTEMESLSFIEQDMATIIRGVVRYAQDQYPGFTHDKSDLNLEVDADPTGVTLTRTWQFADHENIADAIDEFTRSRNGIDWAVTYPESNRVFTVGHPHLGDTLDEPLEWGVNISKFRWSHDRVRKASSVVVLGPGDGPDREEGAATLDTAAGPTLEDVTVAPDGTPPGDLPRLAGERLAVLTNPEVLELTCVGVIGAVHVGDWAPVVIDPPGIDDIYRIVRIDVDPANDSAKLTCNLREPTTPEEAMARFPRAVDACLAPGGGVWVVGSDGGVGAYGGATFHGSLPDDDIIPNAPVVAIVPHGSGGYWLVAADTGVFAYGDAPARGGYLAMITTEYAAGDRAVVAAEPLDPGGDDNLIMIADDGATYAGDLTP